ncbi:MAG: type II secretion system protein [bacterium]|nr:type II secretion system protein [bacterium]
MKILSINKNRGFSLLEISIALVFSSLFLAISVPSLARLKDTNLIKKEAHLIKVALENTSILSTRENREYSFELFNDKFQIRNSNNKKLKLTYKFKEGVSLDLNTPIQIIEFYSSGVVTPKTIKLKTENLSCKITISLRARVKVIC